MTGIYRSVNRIAVLGAGGGLGRNVVDAARAAAMHLVGAPGRFCHGGTIRQARRQTKGYHRPTRSIAGLSGFLTLIQSRDGPDL
jgi:uncharacterized protein YbjT (DUF2867 family)